MSLLPAAVLICLSTSYEMELEQDVVSIEKVNNRAALTKIIMHEV